jgi:hypothetical protein
MRPIWALLCVAYIGGCKEIQDGVSPVQKVLQMMNDMKLKGLNEKQAEAVTFSKFSQFCTDTSSAKTVAIQNGKDKVEQLSADIMKFDSDAKVLSQEIFKLDNDITTFENDKSDATEMRKKEHADFLKTQADYLENVADLEEALTRVKTMMATSPGASAASLLQTVVAKPSMNAYTKRVLTSFLQSTDTELLAGLEVTAPEASVFESQSGSIVGMMEKLAAKLQDEKSQLESEEMSAKHSFDMMTQSLTDQVEQHLETRNSKVVTKKQAEESSASAKGDLTDTQKVLGEDTKYLEDLQIDCATKTKEFNARQKLRGEELDTLDQAIEIIADGSVSGAAEKHLGLVQVGKKQTSFVQLRSDNSRKPTQQLVKSFLKAQGQRLGSNLLSALAMRVGSDQFGKVKKMIQDMVVKLMEEATEEAEHKGFCDTELSTNKQTRDAKSTSVDELTASLEELQATSKQLVSEVQDLSDEITSIDSAVSKATTIRNEEKAKNKATSEDATVAKLAVEKAMRILRTFYDKASQATALVQTHVTESREPFTGMGGQGGILGMLEVILSDFQRLARETEETETVSEKDYEAFMADSQEDKAVKNAEVKHKTSKNTKVNSDIQSTKRDLKNTQEELSAAMSYFEKLKPSCVDAGESYEERVQRRKEEIQSLQESLKILTGEEIA